MIYLKIYSLIFLFLKIYFSCHPVYWDYKLGVLRERIQIKQKGGSS